MTKKMKISKGISQDKIDQYLKTVENDKKEHPSHTTGAKREKLDALRYDFMPSKVVNDAYARVATFGAKKYDVDNWRKGLPNSQIKASLERHLWAYFEGENLDKGEGGSGLSHLDHVLWNAVALVYNEANGIQDDRFPNRLEDKNR